MSKKDETLKLALEALERHAELGLLAGSTITAIREALVDSALDRMAENARELGLDYEPPCKTGSQCTSKCQQCEQPAQQQEPVAWMSAHRFEELRQGFTVMTTLTKQKAFEDDVGIYTSPQSKPWVGLTLDDHIELAKAVAVNKHQIRAIEVKLWEKNA